MDNSFVIVNDKRHAYFNKGLLRIELINCICDNTERRHYTNYPNVIKLCKICMKDICKELLNRLNWETTLYKKYKKKFEENSLISYSVETKMNECKARYNDYKALYLKFTKVKLCTNACIICSELK